MFSRRLCGHCGDNCKKTEQVKIWQQSNEPGGHIDETKKKQRKRN